jgi:hypothetical protein
MDHLSHAFDEDFDEALEMLSAQHGFIPVEVNDFDVLADELPGTVYDMDDYKKQIGNNRFEVLVTMYQEDFNKHYSKNSMVECDAIVKKIVDVTCHKASSNMQNKGRFLVKPYDVVAWRELDDEEAKQFVMQALRTPALEEEDLDQLRDGEEDDDLFAPLPVTSKIDFSLTDIPSMDFRNMGISDNKKRGRRQSLLRRSASEDAMILDKKKGLKNSAGELYSNVEVPTPGKTTFRRYHSGGTAKTSSLPAQGMLQRHHTVSELPPARSLSDSAADQISEQTRNPLTTKGGTIAHTIQGMDVVLASDCKSFSTKVDIVGNNRLKVMLTLEERRFHSLSAAEQDIAAGNLVKAVTDFWKGRILSDKGFAYSILNEEESVEAMKNLLSSAPEHPPHVLGSGGVLSSLTSDKPLPSSTSSSSSSPAKPASKTLLASAPPVPEYLRNASQEILNSGKGFDNLSGPEQMQSAAVRSIKERAGKRQQAKSSRTTSTGSKGGATSPVNTGSVSPVPSSAAVDDKKKNPAMDDKKKNPSMDDKKKNPALDDKKGGATESTTKRKEDVIIESKEIVGESKNEEGNSDAKNPIANDTEEKR